MHRPQILDPNLNTFVIVTTYGPDHVNLQQINTVHRNVIDAFNSKANEILLEEVEAQPVIGRTQLVSFAYGAEHGVRVLIEIGTHHGINEDHVRELLAKELDSPMKALTMNTTMDNPPHHDGPFDSGSKLVGASTG